MFKDPNNITAREAIGAIFLCLIVLGGHVAYQAKEEKGRAASDMAAVHFDPLEVMMDFGGNQIAAERKHFGRRVTAEATALQVERAGGSIHVGLVAGGGVIDCIAKAGQEDRLSHLPPMAKVRPIGTIAGLRNGAVVLTDCVIPASLTMKD